MRSKSHAINPASGHLDARSADLGATARTAVARPTRSATLPMPGVARAPDPSPRPSARAGELPARAWRAVRAHRLGVPFLCELALMVGIFVAYRQIRFLTKGDTDAAMANGRSVIELEQHLGFFTERAVQRAAMSQMAIVHLLDRYYVFMHFSVTAVFLVWAFARHPAAYARIRAWFVGVTLAALAIHVAYPLAPPRMMSGHGFVDTLATYGPRIYSTDTTKSVANQFAAMPSLHFGWAVMVAVGIIAVTRGRWRWLAVVHPVITLLAIVATANHYWADAAVALVLVASAGAAVLWAFARLARPALVAVPVPVAAVVPRPAALPLPVRPAFGASAAATSLATVASLAERRRCPAQRLIADIDGDVAVCLSAESDVDLRDPTGPVLCRPRAQPGAAPTARPDELASCAC